MYIVWNSIDKFKKQFEVQNLRVDSKLTSNRLSTMTWKLVKSPGCNGEPRFLSYDPVLRANLIAATFHS